MDSYRSTVIERPTLTYCVEGLSAREELLFKAFVRLLGHQTHQQWSYQPPAPHLQIDLLVVADGVQPTCSQTANQSSQPILRVGPSTANGHGYLSWPLRPDALENELNRLGGMVLRQRGAPHTQALFTGAAVGSPMVADTSKNLMRLQQWPPSRLLSGVGRMRLATLLTGKAMRLDELVYRSALPLDVCQAFVNDLQQAGLLLSPGSTPFALAVKNSPLPKPAPLGLLERIRLRLGIKSNA
jgi:hypothetical protein